MRNILFLFAGLSAFFYTDGILAQASTSDKYPRKLSLDRNYIQTIVPMVAVHDTVGLTLSTSTETIEYFDGLGRFEQVVTRGGGYDYSDLITMKDYDLFGRESEKWLFTYGGKGTGSCLHVSSMKPNAVKLYNDSNPYVTTNYESSPLNRPLGRVGAGQAWRKAGVSEKYEYLTNKDTPELRCIKYGVSGNRSSHSLRIDGQYNSGALTVTKTTSEDNAITLKFENKLGQTLLSRVKCGDVYLDTYYVYDNFGNLCYVLSPKASAMLTTSINQAALDEMGYQYRYDNRNRCVGKKLPGADWIYSRYDANDRLIFVQDGVLRQNSVDLWAFMMYDTFGREVMTGYLRGKIDGLQIENKNYIATRTTSGGLYGYLFPSDMPTDSIEVASVCYFDDYDHLSEFPAAGLDYMPLSDFGAMDIDPLRSRGLQTGTLEFTCDGAAPLYLVTYYDSKGRPVQIRSTNHLGGVSRIYNKYDFSGKLLKTREEHSVSPDDGQTDNLETRMYYNHTGLLDSTCYFLNGQYMTTVRNAYSNINRLVSVGYGPEENSVINNFQYNLRNWLLEKTVTTADGETLFTMSLRYNNPLYSGTVPSYTGNISEWSWQQGMDADENTYTFSYDALARLTDTKQYVNGTENSRFVERGLNYDDNGNILSLQRTEAGDLKDNFSYTYTGNRLQSISETAPIRSSIASVRSLNIQPRKATDSIGHIITGPIDPGRLIIPIDPVVPADPTTYDDDVNTSDPDTVYVGKIYRYDTNGNMLYDAQQGLNISYNRLNLIEKVLHGNTIMAKYSYLSDGTKLSATDVDGNGLYYMGSLVYRKLDGVLSLESAAFSDGRFLATTNGFVSHYFLTDHLGSVRAVIDDHGTVVERNDYYPFGLRCNTEQLSDNRYRYNGKEDQSFMDVPYADYGARMLDSRYRLGWFALDPQAEKNFSIGTYVFCANNPICLIDNNGEDWYSCEEKYRDGNGEMKTRTRYKFIPRQLSESEMQKKKLKYEGRMHDDGNGNYYSLGGAVVTYDPDRELDIAGLQGIKKADELMETVIDLSGFAGNFWDKYNSVIGLGTDMASIASTFMDASKNFRGTVGSIGGVVAGLNLVDAYKTYQNGAKGLALADAAAAVVSLGGVPGAVISIYYTGGKKLIKKETELEGVLRVKMRRLCSPVGYWF